MGDEEWIQRLNDQGYKNWLKVTLALIESKEALHDFTENIIKDVHNDIKTRIGSAGCTAACNTKKGKPPTCLDCKKWVNEIKSYSAGLLVWKNADPKIWHNKPWEIAKCYMNAQGNPTTAAKNTGPDKTDLSGILNVLVNCKEFGNNHLKEKKLPEHVRTVRNDVMHCPTMSFSDADMKKMVDQVIALLEDEKELKHLSICKEKVKVIKSIRDNEFELKQKHENVCIETALETHALAAESGEKINETVMSKLWKFLKGNKDLEVKFNEKLSKINQEFKVDAEQKAAKFAFDNLEIRERKIDTLSDSPTPRLEDFNNESHGNPTKNAMKSFKVILNEHVQKMTKGEKPDYKTEKNSEGNLGKIYTSPSGVKNISDAKEKAAKEACKALQLAPVEPGNSIRTADLCSKKDETHPEIPGAKTTSNHAASVDRPVRKTQHNFKHDMQEYVRKWKLHPGIRYVNMQDPITKEYLSKVFLGRRCFKGKQTEAKIEEAEQHVAEIALNILEGLGDKPDPKCIELLKEYHKNHGCPSYPKYKESTCDGGKFTSKVTVKKKYEFRCTDKKPKMKDVEIWLAEQAVKLLEEEDKMTRSEGNAKSRLNVFLQLQVAGNLQPKYEVQGSQAAFTGRITFYNYDVYESLCSQNSEKKAIASAAMSACNGMDLQY